MVPYRPQGPPLPTTAVFVYGTLLADDCGTNVFGLPVRVAGSSPAWVAGVLYEGRYPYLVLPGPDDGDAKVHGKLFRLVEADLPVYDRIERVPELYQRVMVGVGLQGRDVTSTTAWAYVRPQREGQDPRCGSGQWQRWRDRGLFPPCGQPAAAQP